jgi:hypothetical protein
MKHLFYLSTLITMACSDVKSSTLDTAGMYLEYDVTTEGEGSYVNVVLRAGGAFGSFVDLDGGDQLIVSVVDGDESSILDASSFLTLHSYDSSFSTDTAGSVFELNFDRETQTDAPSSQATLPEPFTLTAPTAELVISRSEQLDEELEISWDGTSNEDMIITIDGDCFSTYSEIETDDSGVHSVPISIFSEGETDSTSSCTARITVERILEGSVDAAFEGGSSFGRQVRAIDITIEP